MPNEQDILRSSIKTTGIIETRFKCKELDVRLDILFLKESFLNLDYIIIDTKKFKNVPTVFFP